MFPEKMAIVDIETSGARVTGDRVIEIGIVRVENGVVTQRFESLINPQGYVSPFIENYTGITRNMLEAAPTFTDLADQIHELLHDCVFVAHNVRFDYGFIKNEFRRLNRPFSPKLLCTVRLSRKLFPAYRKHSLDALIERFNFTCDARHRALGDADVVWKFMEHVRATVEPITFELALKTILQKTSLPSQIKPEVVAKLPESSGVYIFYDDKGYPLYVGKSINIKDRVLSHFSSDYTSSKEMNIAQQVASIEAIQTPGELTALLREAALVKELQPLYNRKLRRLSKLVLARKVTGDDGYERIALDSVDTIDPHELDTIIGVYKSAKQAKGELEALSKLYGLCHKLLGLEKSNRACFGYQLGTCAGACTGEELALKYNLRMTEAFATSKFKSWPYAGPVLIQEGEHALLVDQWCILGTVSDISDLTQPTPTDYHFDLDTYKILRQHLGSAKVQPIVMPAQLAN